MRIASLLLALGLFPAVAHAQLDGMSADELDDPAESPSPMSAWAEAEVPPAYVLSTERVDHGARRGATAMAAIGGALTGIGALILLSAGLASALASAPSELAVSGSIVVGVGVGVLFAGLYWLIEQADARRARATLEGALIRF